MDTSLRKLLIKIQVAVDASYARCCACDNGEAWTTETVSLTRETIALSRARLARADRQLI